MSIHDAFNQLRVFADVKAVLNDVRSLESLRALNEAVDERFIRDQQRLEMTDADWVEWTLLVRQKTLHLEQL